MSTFSILVATMLALPLLSAIACLIISNERPKLILVVASVSALFAMVLAIGISILSNENTPSTLILNWFSIGSQPIALSLEFDNITVPLLLVVSSISFLVTIYSIGFFKGDQSLSRYFSTLSLFTFCMMVLALSGSLLQLFIFWELVGLCSYLLIGYYRHKSRASAAATKSFIMNKVGDIGFLISLMILWVLGGTFDIRELETSTIIHEAKPMISFFLLIAVFSKSAQFPFHTWLPEAMEGPTPVSALIHSATMVAAGVFLIARLHFIFTPFTMQISAIVGATTALIGGFNALREKDLKKILAWSTLSQLGLMVMVAGNAGFNASFVHLLSHAVFKAGLFLSVGIILLRFQGRSIPIVLVAAMAILISSMIGIPFTVGFLSKESMLSNLSSPIFIGLFFIINMLTVFYSVRFLWLVLPNKKSYQNSTLDFLLALPVLVLVVASFWIFYSWSPLSSSLINEKWNLVSPSGVMTLASVLWILIGTALAVVLARGGKLNLLESWKTTFSFDNFLQLIFVHPIFLIAATTEISDRKIIDRSLHAIGYVSLGFALLVSWFDRTAVDGVVSFVAWISKSIGNLLRQLVAGKIQDYIWWTLLVLMIIIIFAR